MDIKKTDIENAKRTCKGSQQVVASSIKIEEGVKEIQILRIVQ